MKRLVTFLMVVVITQTSYSDCNDKAVLDEVYLSVSASQWVKTKTALLDVAVSATLNDADMVKTRGLIMAQLQKIAKGEWHITQFNRSQDSSGLQKLTVQAEARIEQSGLNQVYQRAKSISKPGLTYRISKINFKPGLKDVEKGKSVLREKLYKKVLAEIDMLNQQYPAQNFSLKQLIFTEPGKVGALKSVPGPMGRLQGVGEYMTKRKLPIIPVSNKITMEGIVVLASNRANSNSKEND